MPRRMWSIRMCAITVVRVADEEIVELSRRHEFDERFGRLPGKPAEPSIERRDDTLAPANQGDEVSVRELPMTLQGPFEGLARGRRLQRVSPETMSRVYQVLSEQRNCLPRRQRIAREGRVGHHTNKPELRDRAGGPARRPPRSEPAMRGVMMLVGRPQQGREDIDIE